MIMAGLFKPGEIDLKKAYTLKFVGGGAGLAEKKKLTAK